MKSLEELGNYYNTALMPELMALEEKRKQVLKKIFLSGGAIAAVVLIIVFILISGRLLEESLVPLLFTIGVAVAAMAGISKWLGRGYVKDFKGGVIEKIIHFIEPSLKYQSDSCISGTDFVKSKIFNRTPERHKGDDYVSGAIDRTKIEFSEIHSEYSTRDSKGNRRWHTIFKGLFFIGDFNKHFKGSTVVLPDTAERFFGRFGNFLQKMNVLRGQLIKMEDPEFEKEFAVYGDDQVEARYILSTSLMRRIVEFKKKTKRRIFLSFVGSKIYVAIGFSKNLFEPRIFHSLIDFSQIVEYYQDMEIAISIVDNLNLNLRIWTKE